MRFSFKSGLKGEGTEVLRNPDRGWYQIVPYALSEDEAATDEWYAPTHTLVLLEINLRAYRSGEIGPVGLRRFNDILERVHQSDCHAILRLMYDWDGRCTETEPEALETILGHIRQLGPLLKKYSEDIFVSQGLLVGNWAEMHGSRFLLLEDMRRLFAAMAEATGEDTYLAVRTPSYWRACLRSDNALLSTPLSRRVGLYNDALCSSESDLGTYADEGARAALYTDKRPPDEERGFTAILSRRAPYGGETACLCPLNEGNAFLDAMADLGVSYLNESYAPDVLDGWKNTLCRRKGPFHGKTCYEAIEAYMGYRLLAEDARMKKGTLSLTLRNIGSAGLYRREAVALVLTPDVGPELAVPSNADTTLWGTRSTLCFPLPDELEPGEYAVSLRIGSIALCNQGAYQPRLQGNLLGRLRVR